jgi:hypothetical protein
VDTNTLVEPAVSPYSAQKMQAVGFYEMLVTGYQTLRYRIPEDTNPNSTSSLY